MTTGCFPVMMDGELLYGVLARHRLLSGARTAADHATELFGRRSAVASFDLPCRLDALAERLPAAAGLCGSDLLSHTLFPFYAAFQTQETREAVEHDLRVSESSNAHHRLGVAAFRVRGVDALRFCPRCLDTQIGDVGVGTWLVAHQLPGVVVCPIDGAWLRDSGVTRARAGRHGYVSPSAATCPSRAPGEEPRAGAAAMQLLQILSRSAAALATSFLPARALSHWRDHYVDRLAGVGLMRSPRKVDQVALNDGLKAFWGPALIHLPTPCSSLGEKGWAAAMVRTHRKAMHPLFHLLLDGFIGHLERGGAVPPVVDAVSSSVGCVGYDQETPKPIAALPANSASRTDWVGLDLRLTAEIDRAAGGIRAALPPARVSMAAIERRVAKVDWLRRRRRKLPCAARALMQAEETVSDFRRRRAEHWISVLGPSCRAWEVMRAAGLRSAQLPMIRAALEARVGASAGR